MERIRQKCAAVLRDPCRKRHDVRGISNCRSRLKWITRIRLWATEFLSQQVGQRDVTVTVIPTTPDQDKAALDYLMQYTDRNGVGIWRLDPIMEPDVEWIKSAGGPLICVERERAHCWRGVIGVDGCIDAPGGSPSDYDRACQIRDYLGAIDLEEGRALILGDMPLETSVWKDASENLFIVRLFYIDRGTKVSQILRQIRVSDFDDPEESINFDISSGQMVIFDSAFPGREQEKKTLSFESAPGRYRILSRVINPDGRTSMLLHKFCIAGN